MNDASQHSQSTDRMSQVAPKGERLVFMVKKEVKRLLESGKTYFSDGKIGDAVHMYERALDIDPNCALIHFNLAYVFHEDGRYEHARDNYQKAIELEPTCSLFLEHLARLNFETLDYSEAIRLFNRASLVGTIQPISLGLWGRALFESGMFNEAVQAFDELLSRDDQETIQVGARFWLIVSYLRLGRLAHARRVASDLLSRKNVDHKLLLDLGENFLKARALDLARDIFERLAIEREELLIARLRLEDITQLEERIDEALPQLFQGDEERVLNHIAHLKNFGSTKISRAMLSLLPSRSPLVREAVVQYQTSFGYDVTDHLEPFLIDPVAFVRRAVYTFLSNWDDPTLVGVVERGLDDPDNETRTIAADYLSRHAAMPSLPHLEQALEASGNDEELRQILRIAIAEVKRRHQETVDSLCAINVSTGERTDTHRPWWRHPWFWYVQSGLLLYLMWKLLWPVVRDAFSAGA